MHIPPKCALMSALLVVPLVSETDSVGSSKYSFRSINSEASYTIYLRHLSLPYTFPPALPRNSCTLLTGDTETHHTELGHGILAKEGTGALVHCQMSTPWAQTAPVRLHIRGDP